MGGADQRPVRRRVDLPGYLQLGGGSRHHVCPRPLQVFLCSVSMNDHAVFSCTTTEMSKRKWKGATGSSTGLLPGPACSFCLVLSINRAPSGGARSSRRAGSFFCFFFFLRAGGQEGRDFSFSVDPQPPPPQNFGVPTPHKPQHPQLAWTLPATSHLPMIH